MQSLPCQRRKAAPEPLKKSMILGVTPFSLVDGLNVLGCFGCYCQTCALCLESNRAHL